VHGKARPTDDTDRNREALAAVGRRLEIDLRRRYLPALAGSLCSVGHGLGRNLTQRVKLKGCPLMEGHMFESIQSNIAEQSFFYLLMAATNFQRAGRARHPHAADALRDIGREYLAKAAAPDAWAFAVCPR
jgi:hypothetical protein